MAPRITWRVPPAGFRSTGRATIAQRANTTPWRPNRFARSARMADSKTWWAWWCARRALPGRTPIAWVHTTQHIAPRAPGVDTARHLRTILQLAWNVERAISTLTTWAPQVHARHARRAPTRTAEVLPPLASSARCARRGIRATAPISSSNALRGRSCIWVASAERAR